MGTRRLHLIIRGQVQGVGFRWFAKESAGRLEIEGWVRNLANGEVEAQAQGSPEALEKFVREMKAGPSYAKVESVESREMPVEESGNGFSIRHNGL